VTRIEWSPDGALLLAHTFRGTPRVRTPDGSLVRSVDSGSPVLDVRWAGDRLVTIDTGSQVTTFEPSGEREALSLYQTHALWASLAAAGTRVALGDTQAAVYDNRLDVYAPHWRHDPVADAGLHPYDRHHHHDALRRHFRGTLSDDGARIAIGFDSTTWDLDEPGFRWRVIDIDANREVDTDYVPGAGPLALAFDASGRRLAYARPAPHGPIGVVELGKGQLLAYPELLTGAGAVALDPHGVLAAFAIGSTVRFDDLDSGSSLTLPVDLFDIVALAFSPDSHSLACLASNGRVAVVPVP
jgi:hypothetical protein